MPVFSGIPQTVKPFWAVILGVSIVCASSTTLNAGPRNASKHQFNYQALKSAYKPAQVTAKATNLRNHEDFYLQQRVEAVLKHEELNSAIADQRLSVALVDITNLEYPRVASINGDTMMYAASLPKIALLLGAYEMANRQHQLVAPEMHEVLTSMIRYSSNTAATAVYDEIGPSNLASILQSKRYKLYDNKQNGGLWVGRPYGKADAWKRDPLHNISHGATANQVARFYYMLEKGQLVSPAASSEMKEILSHPGINHKFVLGLADRPDAKIFRKSGSWRNFHSDSAIIENDGKRYIAVVLANDTQGGKWIEQLIGTFDDVIHEEPHLIAKQGAANLTSKKRPI